MHRFLGIVVVMFAALVAMPAHVLAQDSAGGPCTFPEWATQSTDPAEICTGPDDPRLDTLCADEGFAPPGYHIPTCDEYVSPCSPQADPVERIDIAYEDDGRWRDGSDLFCAYASTYTDTSVGVPQTQLAFGLYPRSAKGEALGTGTRFSVHVVLRPGNTISGAIFTARHVSATIGVNELQVQGESVDQRLPTNARGVDWDHGGECGPVTTLKAAFNGNLDLAPPPGTPDFGLMPGGGWFATNAAAFSRPMFVNSVVTAFVGGCGDGDPDTNDGFFEAFLPASTLIAPSLIGLPVGDIGDELAGVTDDGNAADADIGLVAAGLGLERVAGQAPVRLPATSDEHGLHVDYAMSFSQHVVRIAVHKRAVSFMRACKRKHGRVHARHHKLSCVVKKPKRKQRH